MDLIYSTFDEDSEEQENIRTRLVGILKSVSEYKQQSKGTRKPKTDTIKVKGRRVTSDPFRRWALICSIDKSNTKSFLPQNMEVRDWHRVFFFPMYGKILIEKMYDKEKGIIVHSYSAATYILESDEFFKYLDEIIINRAINRSFLFEKYKRDEAHRIVHDKNWAENLLKKFGIIKGMSDSKHTKEELEEIFRNAERVNESRRER